MLIKAVSKNYIFFLLFLFALVLNGYASEVFEEETSLEELVELSDVIVIAEKGSPHIIKSPVPVNADDIEVFMGWFAVDRDQIAAAEYHVYNRPIYMFKVIEILKIAAFTPKETLVPGDAIYAAGATDYIDFSGHIMGEIFRVHGLEISESPIYPSYNTHLINYGDTNRMVLFLYKGISLLSDEENLGEISEDSNSLFTFTADNSYESVTELNTIRQIIDR
jgi:hypothetical protein